jgi:hypothetical protein
MGGPFFCEIGGNTLEVIEQGGRATVRIGGKELEFTEEMLNSLKNVDPKNMRT